MRIKNLLRERERVIESRRDGDGPLLVENQRGILPFFNDFQRFGLFFVIDILVRFETRQGDLRTAGGSLLRSKRTDSTVLFLICLCLVKRHRRCA